MKKLLLWTSFALFICTHLFANTIYQINTRQYSSEGTFQKVTDDLERIKKLGVTTIWFMPVQKIGVLNRKGTLGSPYSISDYRAINNELGTEKDFQQLVNKAHTLGLKVIIDWVANHTAWDHAWTKSNPDFFYKKDGKFILPADGWDDVIDLNYDNHALWQAMISDMIFWLKTYNIDGFRCDVASMVPTDFWIEARKQINTVKNVFMLAESSDANLLDVKAFDAIYADDIYDLMFDVVDGKKRPETIFNVVKSRYSANQASRVYMNFADNHDKNSWVGTFFDRAAKGSAYKTLTALIFTLPEATLVYDGHEAPLDKQLDFFERDTINWNGYIYQNFISKLGMLKKTHPALNDSLNGKFEIIYSTVWEDRDLLMFTRTVDSKSVVVMMNLSPYDRTFNIYNTDTIPTGMFQSLENGKQINVRSEKQFILKAWEFRIYNN